MYGGIADIDRYAVAAMFSLNAFQILGHLVESFVPANLLPSTIGPPHRVLEPILIEVDILQGNCFRADVAMAEDILGIALDTERAVWLHTNFDTTHCLTDIASAEMMRGVF